MGAERGSIRVKAMLIAPNGDASSHAVSLNPPTLENGAGFHRLIGGSVELGETHREAVLREVREELGATVEELAYVGVVENIFTVDGDLGHEVVFLYSGRLSPAPATTGATLTEADGTVLPVVWRPVRDEDQALPLYPVGAGRFVAAAARTPGRS